MPGCGVVRSCCCSTLWRGTPQPGGCTEGAGMLPWERMLRHPQPCSVGGVWAGWWKQLTPSPHCSLYSCSPWPWVTDSRCAPVGGHLDPCGHQ